MGEDQRLAHRGDERGVLRVARDVEVAVEEDPLPRARVLHARDLQLEATAKVSPDGKRMALMAHETGGEDSRVNIQPGELRAGEAVPGAPGPTDPSRRHGAAR